MGCNVTKFVGLLILKMSDLKINNKFNHCLLWDITKLLLHIRSQNIDDFNWFESQHIHIYIYASGHVHSSLTPDI